MSLIPARIDSIALAVADVGRSVSFYAGTLGFEQLPPPQAAGTFRVGGADLPFGDAIVSFQLANVVLTVIDRRLLADEEHRTELPPAGATTLAVWVPRDEVGACVQRLAAAGVRVLAPAEDNANGVRIGFVADPDGHVWEILQLF